MADPPRACTAPADADEVTITLETSKTILASRLNLTPETLSRIFAELTRLSAPPAEINLGTVVRARILAGGLDAFLAHLDCYTLADLIPDAPGGSVGRPASAGRPDRSRENILWGHERRRRTPRPAS